MNKNIKRKNSIKISAAAEGLPFSFSDLLSNWTGGDALYDNLKGLFNNSENPQWFLNLTAFADKAAPYINVATTGAELIGDRFKKSTATSGKEAVTNSIESVGKGALKGAAAGAAFGGAGAIVGGAVGGAVGLVGNKGRAASMQSFTEYDKGTLGSGLIGALKNKDQRAEKRRIQSNAFLNNYAVDTTAQNEADFAEMNGENRYDNLFSAEFGGMPSSLAYVDDGEMINTPNGNISTVPDLGRPTDSNLVSLPEDSRVLSNSLKVPGTKKTFAEMGKKLIRTRKSKYDDKPAENALTLNQLNNLQAFNDLYDLQEAVKAEKGIKPKAKTLQYRKGGCIPAYDKGDDEKISRNSDWKDQFWRWKINNYRKKTSTNINPYSNSSSTFRYYNNGLYDKDYLDFVKKIDEKTAERINNYVTNNLRNYTAKNQSYRPTADQIKRLATDRNFSDFHQAVEAIYNNLDLDRPDISSDKVRDIVSSSPILPSPNYDPPSNLYDASINTRLNSLWQPINVYKKRGGNGTSDSTTKSGSTGSDYQLYLADIVNLAPSINDLFTKPESYQMNTNPYSAAIASTMGPRRFNISPTIRDIDRNMATSMYNARNINTNTGANMAYNLSSASAANRLYAQARAEKNKYDNEYKSQYALMMDQLGREYVESANRAQELNAKSRANARNLQRQAQNDIANYINTRLKDRNQRNADIAMLNVYRPFLESGIAKDYLNGFYDSIKLKTNA